MIFNFKLYSRDVFIFIKLRNVKRDVEATKYHLMHIFQVWNYHSYIQDEDDFFVILRNGNYYDSKGRSLDKKQNESDMKFIFSLNRLSLRSCMFLLYYVMARMKRMKKYFNCCR